MSCSKKWLFEEIAGSTCVLHVFIPECEIFSFLSGESCVVKSKYLIAGYPTCTCVVNTFVTARNTVFLSD
jgi:hypothetical protein